MKLTQHELIAVRWWMEDEGLSGKAAAAALEITERALRKWLAGGGMHPSQRAKLLKLIDGYLADSMDIEKIEREKAGLELREGWPGEAGTITGYAAYQASDRAIKKFFGVIKPPAQRGDLAAHLQNRQSSPEGQLQKRDKSKLSDGEYLHKHQKEREFFGIDDYVETLIRIEVDDKISEILKETQSNNKDEGSPERNYIKDLGQFNEAFELATKSHSDDLHKLFTCHLEATKKRDTIISSKSELIPDECAHLIGNVIYLSEILKGMNEYRKSELDSFDFSLHDKIIDVIRFRINAAKKRR